MSSKPRKTIKLTPGRARQIESAIALLREHYGDLLAIWVELPRLQREAVLRHSPLLAALLRMFGGDYAA